MRLHWLRHLQSVFVGLVLLSLVFLATLLWKSNQRGFGGEWEVRLTEELSKRGLHADFSSARLSMSRGLVARDLVIYSDSTRENVMASADVLELDIDRSRALRGQYEVRSITFENAFVHLSEACHPHHLNQLSGTATFSRENCLIIRETTGQLGELGIHLDAELHDVLLTEEKEKKEPQDNQPLEEFLASLHQEIAQWSSSKETPTTLDLRLKGSFHQPSSLELGFSVTAPQISRRNYSVSDLTIQGTLRQHALRIQEVSFTDEAGPLTASGNYEFNSKIASLEVSSDAALSKLLGDGLGIHSLKHISFPRPPHVEAKGKVYFSAGYSPALSFTGHLSVDDLSFFDTTWSRLESDFSLQKNDLYLRDLALIHPEGELKGQLLFQDELIRYRAHSTLPIHLFSPFFKNDGAITSSIEKADFRDDSEVILDLIGSIRPSDLTDWSASGQATLKNLHYNRVPVNYATAHFNLTQLQSVYNDVEVEFDLTEGRPFNTFGGPETAIVRADSILFERNDMLTTIEHIHGVCWPSTVLALFLPDTANFLERTYRASEPPAFSSSGTIDHRSAERTSFHTQIECPAPLYYDFLGKEIQLRDTSVLIHSHQKQVDIKNLSCYSFSGPIKGDFSILFPNQEGRNTDYRGSLIWTRLSLADIVQTYDFDQIEKGLVTGRLDFIGTTGRIETLNGSGSLALEQGELFKAPVFGPLSPLISGIQGHDKASHDTARDASANFLIQDGTLITDDFITSTSSLTVHAEGSVDLARKTLDITARADTKGLLKLVTLPLNLTPFSGLFQFRGTGPITDPQWNNTPFTPQTKKKKPPLFAPPPKARVVPE